MATPMGRSALMLAALVAVLAVATAAHAADPLGAYKIDRGAISVSGLSSGGFMAQQFHVVHSKELIGAGIIAGGPYDCANSRPGWLPEFTATDVCSYFIKTVNPFVPFLGPPDVRASLAATRAAAKRGAIDPPLGLAGDKVYLFSGTKDSIVPQAVMDGLKTYYRAFMPAKNITYVNDIPAEHAMVTDDFGNGCDTLGSPYINNCHYDTAGALLGVIYGALKLPGDAGSGTLIAFDQAAFLPAGGDISMNPVGHLFVPADCVAQAGCRLHIAFHGCLQSQEVVGDAWYGHAGYNKWAATNRIIVLYPQTRASDADPLNPNGCWDWWGYTGSDFNTRSGKQIVAVQKMIDRLAQ
jgi:hypothetical protein